MADRKSFIQVPPNVADATTLKRFLEKLVLQIDEAFGNRGDSAFLKEDEWNKASGTISATVQKWLGEFREEIVEMIELLEEEIAVIKEQIEVIEEDILELREEDLTFVKLDGSRKITGELLYDDDVVVSEDQALVNKKYVDDNFTDNPAQADIANLSLTISNPPTQSEVQTISDKIDTVLNALRNSKILN